MTRRLAERSVSGNCKLTATQALEILRRASVGERNSILAKEYQVSESAIGRIVSRQTWTKLESPWPKESRNKGERHFRAKMNENKVRSMRLGYAEGKSYRELAHDADVSISTAFHVIQGHTWKHV